MKQPNIKRVPTPQRPVQGKAGDDLLTGRSSNDVIRELTDQLQYDQENAFALFDLLATTLFSLHQYCSPELNWDHLLLEPEPKLPRRLSARQHEAELEQKAYQPGLLDRLFLQRKRKQSQLAAKVNQAIQEDDLIYNKRLKQFKADLLKWQRNVDLAEGVKRGEVNAFETALSMYDPFQALSALGVGIRCRPIQHALIIDIQVCAAELLPDFILKRGSGGQIYKERLLADQFNRSYHDFVCSCAIRTAMEGFALLPVNTLFLNVHEQAVDAHFSKVIFSIRFVRAGLLKARRHGLPVREAIMLFEPRVKFDEADGFSAIDPLPDNAITMAGQDG